MEEILNELEVKVQQKIDEHLAEQREIELIDEGLWMKHKSIFVFLSMAEALSLGQYDFNPMI